MRLQSFPASIFPGSRRYLKLGGAARRSGREALRAGQHLARDRRVIRADSDLEAVAHGRDPRFHPGRNEQAVGHLGDDMPEHTSP